MHRDISVIENACGMMIGPWSSARRGVATPGTNTSNGHAFQTSRYIAIVRKQFRLCEGVVAPSPAVVRLSKCTSHHYEAK